MTVTSRPAAATDLASSELCSDADLAAGDDLRGTAATFLGFLIVEQRGSFGREAAEDAISSLYGDEAATILGRERFRPLAIRPIGRPESFGVRARFAGRCGVAPSLRLLDATPGPAELDRLTAPGATIPDPLFAVCTNGSRDRCCAVKGRDLAGLLHHEIDGPGSDEDATVVEVSHIGGHRFAPTMIVLPFGYSYGRLDLATAIEIAYAAQDGLVHPTGIRGRADLSPVAQVADAYWRAEIGEPAPLDAITKFEIIADGPDQLVTATVQNRSESLRLTRTTGPTISETRCGGKPITTETWIIR